MTRSCKRLLSAVLAILVLQIAATAQPASSKKPASAAYTWKNVQIVGGGFVDGIIVHPTEKGVCYCRTDIGGAYKRNEKTMRWEPLLDWVSYDDLNLMGVESIALDPSDPNRVYLSCGTYTNRETPDGAILRSTDRGNTFQRTNVPFKMGGNENGRGNGERMAVDPNEGSILYLGTRHAGLWKSVDRAATWNRVGSFPDVTELPPSGMRNADSINFWRWSSMGSGVVFVVFDPQSGSAGKSSSTLYVGVSLLDRPNLFRTTDAGSTWHAVTGQPTRYRPSHAVLASDGWLYLTYGTSPGPSRMSNGGVWKFNTKSGAWKEITPDKPDPDKGHGFGYAAVSVDAQNPQALIVSSFGRASGSGEDDIFRSTDGGATWKTVFGGGGTYDFSLAPYVARTPIHWLFDIEIDPADSRHAIFTTGYGGYETFNLIDADNGKPTQWRVMSSGIEETVALDLLSPPKGAHLISAVGDYCGFVHWDLGKPAPEGHFENPRFGNTTGLACAENNPDIIVRVGRASHNRPGPNIGYSLDGGRTWQPTTSSPEPDSRLGSIAVSTDGTTWIWAPEPVYKFSGTGRTQRLLPVYVTTDRGASWGPCQGIPGDTRVIADRVNPKKFYGLDLFGGKLYNSGDNGVHFTEQSLNLPGGLPRQHGNRGDDRGGQDRLYAAPGKEGDLWIAAFDGLHHSTDGGNEFQRIGEVTQIHGFGFGKGAPGASYSSLYLIGIVSGVRGIFRSDDIGREWLRINDDRHQWGLLLQITGDPKVFGRVYVGSHGRGTFYGDPVQ